MEKFVYLNTIKFNNKRFKVFTSKTYPIYLLEILEDGSLCYPEYEDFIAYFKQFMQFNSSMIYNFAGATTSRKTSNKTTIKPKNFNFMPKVLKRTETTVKAITLALALVLSGCSQSTSVTPPTKSPETTESPSNNSAENETENETNASEFEEDDLKRFKEDLKKFGDSQGYDIYFPNFDSAFIHQYNCEEFGGDTIFCKNIGEFKKYINQKGKPTYEDLKNIFAKNETLPEEYKEWINEGLDNLQKEMPNLDLSVLYHNAQKMTFTEATAKDIKEKLGRDTIVSYFSSQTGEVVYNPENVEFNKFTFLHEVLGHGSTEAMTKKDETNIYHGFRIPILYMDQTIGTITPFLTGSAFSEGAADRIARISIGEEKAPESIYSFAEEELRLISEICYNNNFEDLINNRGNNLYTKMADCNIDLPTFYAMASDDLLFNYNLGGLLPEYKDENTMDITTILETAVVDAYENNLTPEVIEKATSIMDKTDIDKINLYYWNDNKEKYIVDYYNPKAASEEVEHILNAMQKDVKQNTQPNIQEQNTEQNIKLEIASNER